MLHSRQGIGEILARIEFVDARATQLKVLLASAGAVCVSKVKDDQSLEILASMFGAIRDPGVGMSSALRNEGIYTVQVRNAGKGILDDFGNVIYSSTSDPFELHTDAYNSNIPPRYVLLRRTDSSTESPLSMVADGRDALSPLDVPAQVVLRQPSFPSANGLVPIVISTTAGTNIRFNSAEIGRWQVPCGVSLSVDAVQAISAFLSATRRSLRKFVLRQFECLILDNWRMLHGRSALSTTSTRTVQRMWVDSPSDSFGTCP